MNYFWVTSSNSFIQRPARLRKQSFKFHRLQSIECIDQGIDISRPICRESTFVYCMYSGKTMPIQVDILLGYVISIEEIHFM